MEQPDDTTPAGTPEPGDPTTQPTTPQRPSDEPPGGDPPGGDPPHDGADGGAAEPDRPRRLFRSKDERMIAGVAGGLGEYFGIDPVIVRVIAVVLVFAGGAGLLLYLAAWLLVPEQGQDPDERRPGLLATVAGGVALVCALGALLPFWGGPFGGDWGFGGAFLFFTVVGVAGLVVWRLATGERPLGGGARETLRRAGLGVALLAVSGLLAFGGAWATASGGGTVVAAIVIVAGLWLVAGAFLGGARWLILPAIALALPAGVVSAADIDARGGIGEREYRPATPESVRTSYEVGVGRIVIDLRDVDLSAGDHRMKVDVGMGEAWIVVPENVCVTSRATAGAGQIDVFDRGSGGIDVDWEDVRRAPSGTPRLVLDGHLGVGLLAVTHDDPDLDHHDDFGPDRGDVTGNSACIGGSRG